MTDASTNGDGQTGEAGFTLVEALVAIALTALILSFLSGALNFGLKAWRASDDVDRIVQMNAAKDFLRRTLAAAEPIRVRGKDGKLQLVFHGENQRLEFVAAMPEQHVKAGVYKVSLYLEPERAAAGTEQTFTMQIGITPFYAGRSKPAVEIHEASLLAGVERFEISYFGDPAGDGKPEWHPQWEGGHALPSLVRINIGLEEEGHKPLPTLIAEVKMR